MKKEQPGSENGWTVESGSEQYESDGKKGIVMLLTATGNGKMVNVLALTNTDAYQKDITDFLESISLPKITPATKTTTTNPSKPTQQIQTPVANDDKNSIIGTWGISVVVPYRRDQEGTAGSNVRQYTFNADGTYNFYIKTFRYSVVELSLTRETGTYRINGNNLTINPQKSVIEAWSKKDGTDKWGQLISSQNKTSEKTTYQFTKHYSVGMQHWAVVLQANKETKRDGYYNGDTLFSNSWIYNPVTCKDCFIKLPE